MSANTPAVAPVPKLAPAPPAQSYYLRLSRLGNQTFQLECVFPKEAHRTTLVEKGNNLHALVTKCEEKQRNENAGPVVLYGFNAKSVQPVRLEACQPSTLKKKARNSYHWEVPRAQHTESAQLDRLLSLIEGQKQSYSLTISNFCDRFGRQGLEW